MHRRRQHRVGRLVPPGHEDRGDRRHLERLARLRPAFQRAQVGFCGLQVVGVGEQQGHVDADPLDDALLERGQPGRRAGNLHQQVRPPGLPVQPPRDVDAGGRVVGQPWRHLQRHVAVDPAGGVVDGPEQVGGGLQVLQRDRVNHLLRVAYAGGQLRAQRVVVAVAGGHRMPEDGRVGGQSGDRQVVAVAGQRAAGQHRSVDGIQPKALASVVESLRRVHRVTSRSLVVERACSSSARAASAATRAVMPVDHRRNVERGAGVAGLGRVDGVDRE